MLDKKNLSPKALSQERVKHLMLVAEQAFMEKGLDGCSIDHICRQSGVSKSTIYRHYPNKVALFEAVCRAVATDQAKELSQVALDLKSPLVSLRALSSHIHQLEARPRYREFFRLFISEAGRHPELIERIRQEGVARVIERIATFFVQLINQGKMKHPNPTEAAITYYVLSRGHIRSLLRSESELNTQDEWHCQETEMMLFYKGCEVVDS